MNLEKRDTAILLFSCVDQKGIVAEVSQFIANNNGNIIDSDQHNDEETNTFFMRVEWDLKDFAIKKVNISDQFKSIAEKFKLNWKLEFGIKRKKTAIFVSKIDHCLYDLLLRNKSNEIDADIDLIISNHKDTKQIADYFKIPFHFFEVLKENKLQIEKDEIKLLKEKNIDLIILARYMQILSDNFVSEFNNKIINIHHSFLPAFVGAKPYHQAFSRGVKIIGATSHYVTAALDQGPIIEQDVIRISHKDNVKTLIQKGRNLEKIVLAKAVKSHIENRVLVFRNKTIVFN